MNDTLNMGHAASVELVRGLRPNGDNLELHGLYHVEHWHNDD